MDLDVVVRGGLLADGLGGPLRRADVGVRADRVVAVGEIGRTDADALDAAGAVVAPGFINVLSQAYESLQRDPRGLSDLYQGVTTEVFGEGYSMGPVQGRMAGLTRVAEDRFGVRHHWPHLLDYLHHMETTGVGPNLASFVGAENLRMAFAGEDQRALGPDELQAACELLDGELADGALGLGSALIYPPGSWADTAELAAYARVVARHDALYVSHVRDEADRLLEGIGELIEIAATTGARAEVYHLKAAGRANWPAMTKAIELIEHARADGVTVTADVYPYEAGATGLDACIPPAFHDGGPEAMRARLRQPAVRREVKALLARPGDNWENTLLGAGGPGGVLLLGGLTTASNGLTLAQVAADRGDADPVDTLMDVVIEDPDMIAAYFEMTEDNVRLALERPWVSVCSDSEAWAAEPPYTDYPTHPRAYGSFARVLGPYVRDGVLPLADAVRRMTSLPAGNLRLTDRGVVRTGAFADLAVFEPDVVADRATYADPHQYAVGMRHVLVNGRVALRDGDPTGALAGRALRRAPTVR